MASNHETIFTMEATPVKFGTGASAEAGWDLKRLGVKRAMLVTDPGVAALGHPERIKKLIEEEGIEVYGQDGWFYLVDRKKDQIKGVCQPEAGGVRIGRLLDLVLQGAYGGL